MPTHFCHLFFWQQLVSGLLEGRRNQGGRGVEPPPHFCRPITLFQSGRGQIMPTTLLLAPPPLPDFQNFLRHDMYHCLHHYLTTAQYTTNSDQMLCSRTESYIMWASLSSLLCSKLSALYSVTRSVLFNDHDV